MKFLKWWLQCYLIDTRRLLVGMRDEKGIVKSLVKCNVEQICAQAQVYIISLKIRNISYYCIIYVLLRIGIQLFVLIFCNHY